ncbi:glycosyltransferase family 2 protein [Pollutimonas thiosulfatoxidans]|uniref:Glycosyltransferase 2-like domain-containing protein n=1 Tax=Pollutimonas thiosulfatoxidans TaxID=2028345 RepID=A0A410GEH8_9BURK|nr:glycosyltransferase family 2 protein [Pollutimonas thiosulfatoxidans]QAA94688.1 hypothetical protein CKA81_13185 [Pollutimonas thiosulfatoxidans]
MKLSIITTLYNSEPFIQEFYNRISRTASQKANEEYELIFVVDGSPDNALSLALEIQASDPKVHVIELSRNFGHHAAIIAGLSHCQGDQVFLIDCDLEEQPEWLSLFYKTQIETQSDVVFGVQAERVSSRNSNFFGELFWSALNLMSSVSIPHSPMTCRLMTKQYVESLLEIGDRVLYLAGAFAWAGFKQTAIPLKKSPRPKEYKSSYSLSRKLVQVVDSFASFSIAPLTLIFFVGLTVWLGSLLFAAALLIEKAIYPDLILSGFTAVMLSLWFIGGTIILFLGILGLYLAKIFQEVKRRPLYLVRNHFSKD